MSIFKRSSKKTIGANPFEISLKMNAEGRKLEYFSKDKVSEWIREIGVSETNFSVSFFGHKRPGEGPNELDVITAVNEDLQKKISLNTPCLVTSVSFCCFELSWLRVVSGIMLKRRPMTS